LGSSRFETLICSCLLFAALSEKINVTLYPGSAVVYSSLAKLWCILPLCVSVEVLCIAVVQKCG
jgi:hypothetical protein